MGVRMQLTGMEALLQQLAHEPADVRAAGVAIVNDETDGGAEDLRRHYPEESRTTHGTGTLRGRVRTVPATTSQMVGQVQSRAPHAHLWHWGTRKRRTKKGHNRGRMPAASPEPIVPIAVSRRRRMLLRLKAMLEGRGYQVTGI